MKTVSSIKYSNLFSHTFFVLVAVGIGDGVYRKLYTSIGGQRAEKFDNHWPK